MTTPWLRWILSAAIAALLALLGADQWARYRLARTVQVPASVLLQRAETGDAEAGARLYTTVLNCAECHGARGEGGVVIDDAFVGRVVAPGLTAGARPPAEWDRAVRHGVASDGRALVLMPSDGYAHLSDADLSDLIAFLGSLPHEPGRQPSSELAYGGRQLAAWGALHVPAFGIDHAAVGRGAGDNDGAYLARVSGCHGCHGEALEGRSMGPGQPYAPGLAGDALDDWTVEDFGRALREGRTPDGRTLDPRMPWAAMSGLSDLEVRALWGHVRRTPTP